jgi:hypothetical protein
MAGPRAETKMMKSLVLADCISFALTDIAGQFEMIQHTWLNGASFNGLYEETDPVSHYRLPNDKSCITFQHRPTNLRIPIPKFVTVLGGGYFFLPGIKALQSLAQ